MSTSETENLAIPSPTPKRSRPRTNRDWGPNQLDLTVLPQHARRASLLGDGFDFDLTTEAVHGRA
ncbi:MAG: hypothetical protein ABW252_04970 [Polyangiales bacterium]